MNYKGKHGKNYEIPTIIKRCCFSDTGHKLLMQEGLFNYKIQDPLSVIDDKFLFCMEFDRAIHEIEDNLGISAELKT
ncbi:hypothetical protein SAMN04487884_1562 [Butyrivibrio fibrisolvens]|uniref:Uncharacterized protein n=1 Tax=Butyrivibrio fibrisolvens TaxID=831 RepID=A0A1H9XBY6_BUTFI|nr:hypothetical protein [Butyrivibrio fibrisolvens]SES43645.1 hypothetical protein SAMN04487884_1562 [Butyrivibrio fibrisolvens]